MIILKTIKEVAPILNSSETTIRRLIRRRQIPFRQVGRRIFFTDNDLNEYLQNIKVELIHSN